RAARGAACGGHRPVRAARSKARALVARRRPHRPLLKPPSCRNPVPRFAGAVPAKRGMGATSPDSLDEAPAQACGRLRWGASQASPPSALRASSPAGGGRGRAYDAAGLGGAFLALGVFAALEVAAPALAAGASAARLAAGCLPAPPRRLRLRTSITCPCRRTSNRSIASIRSLSLREPWMREQN